MTHFRHLTGGSGISVDAIRQRDTGAFWANWNWTSLALRRHNAVHPVYSFPSGMLMVAVLSATSSGLKVPRYSAIIW